MEKKYIMFGSVLAVFLLMLVPSVSAIQYEAMENNQEKIKNEIAQLETKGCIYTKLLLIWNILYIFSISGVIKKIGIDANKPVIHGGIRVSFDWIYTIGVYYLAQAAANAAGNANESEELPWYLPKEFIKLPWDESKFILFGMFLKAFVYAFNSRFGLRY